MFAEKMENQVPFKVFAYWTEDGKPEVRRFGVERSVVTSFHYLNAKLQDVYPGLRNRSYSVAWKGELQTKCFNEISNRTSLSSVFKILGLILISK